MNDDRHLPVMVNEVVSYLCQAKDGAYLDLTVGLGGHLKAVGSALSKKGSLYGLDRDPQAVAIARENLTNCKQLKKILPMPYGQIDQALEKFEQKEFDGILMDLGVSSYQIDSAERGFSFRFDGPLDMRFNSDSMELNAADLVNSFDKKELVKIFRQYGEERQSVRIANAIVKHREESPIITTMHLKEVIESVVRPNYLNKTLARIFQALRIAVNEELKQLSDTLPKLPALLKRGGRLVILTYHSLEDRIIKHFYNTYSSSCICPDHYNVCMCDHVPSLKVLNRKGILPGPLEIETNSRARSAKLRVAEKI